MLPIFYQHWQQELGISAYIPGPRSTVDQSDRPPQTNDSGEEVRRRPAEEIYIEEEEGPFLMLIQVEEEEELFFPPSTEKFFGQIVGCARG